MQHETSTGTLSIRERIAGYTKAMTAEDLAAILNISTLTVYRYAKKGILPSFRIGTLVRFDPKATANWVASMGGAA